jgi:hypothetical protein
MFLPLQHLKQTLDVAHIGPVNADADFPNEFVVISKHDVAVGHPRVTRLERRREANQFHVGFESVLPDQFARHLFDDQRVACNTLRAPGVLGRDQAALLQRPPIDL